MPKAVELRSTAINRAAAVAVPKGATTLVLDVRSDKVLSSSFEGAVLKVQHQFAADFMPSLLGEYSRPGRSPFAACVYIDPNADAAIRDTLRSRLVATGVLTEEGLFISAADIFRQHFPSRVTMENADRLIVALGLALREVEHAL